MGPVLSFVLKDIGTGRWPHATLRDRHGTLAPCYVLEISQLARLPFVEVVLFVVRIEVCIGEPDVELQVLVGVLFNNV